MFYFTIEHYAAPGRNSACCPVAKEAKTVVLKTLQHGTFDHELLPINTFVFTIYLKSRGFETTFT